MIGTKEKRESRSLRVQEGLLMAGFQERKKLRTISRSRRLIRQRRETKLCLVVIHYLQWAFPSAMLSYSK